MKVLSKVARTRVATVSYLNTIPFIYGFDHSPVTGMYDLRLGNPEKCFRLFSNNEADIALVPVAALTQLGKCKIIQPFCIGANGKVGSVFLLSDVPPADIETVYLDSHSVTSNKLVEILFREYWKTEVSFVIPENYPPQIRKNDAIIAIGDKSFKMTAHYKYATDLAEAWKEFTGLPFVFAVWITRLNLHPSVITSFNAALKYGVDNINDSIIYAKPEVLPVEDTVDYLTNKIRFRLHDELLKGMTLFLNKIYPGWKNSIEFI